MAEAKKALFDKRKLALAKAKFRAWWDGESFDEDAFVASLEAEAANDATAAPGDPEKELFDEPETEAPPRIVALGKLWGDQRLRPGDDAADALEVSRLGAPADGVIAVSGAGLAGPLIAFASAHAGPIEAFEWREESIDLLKQGVRKAKLDGRVSVTRIDLEAHVFKAGHFDGLWSVDDFAYVGFPPHLSQQVMKMLKPGACAVVECYVGLKIPEFATAFASSFAEPQIRAHGDVLQNFIDVGLTVEADEDLTDDFLALAKQGFKRLETALADAASLTPLTLQELAWEAETWRTRLRLLAQRRLERRRFTLRKPAADAPEAPAPEAQPENTNTPEG
jgi:hypothetical protein